jgi:dipeptidyl-peptidase-3
MITTSLGWQLLKVMIISTVLSRYNDPLGYRGSYEGIVQIKDFDMSKKWKFSGNAQWFEDNSPLMPQHKRRML